MWNPWRTLRRRPDITLELVRLRAPQTAGVIHATRTILLDPRIGQRHRNDAVAHELVHLERGPAVVGFEVHEERAVEEETARRLIPIGDLCRALRWTRDVDELAEELWVSRETLLVRMATMTHPAERAAVRRVVEEVEVP